MKISNWEDLEETEARPGILRKVITRGGIQVIQYRYAPGSVFEDHFHPEEQMTIVLSGSLYFIIAGKKATVRKGDIVHIPGNIHHEAVNNENEEALTLNIYTPPKKGI